MQDPLPGAQSHAALAAHLASRTDLNESRLLGQRRFSAQFRDRPEKWQPCCACPQRTVTGFQFAAADVSLVANREKTVPASGLTGKATAFPGNDGLPDAPYGGRGAGAAGTAFLEYFTISP